jgi:hypothetical protein
MDGYEARQVVRMMREYIHEISEWKVIEVEVVEKRCVGVFIGNLVLVVGSSHRLRGTPEPHSYHDSRCKRDKVDL